MNGHGDGVDHADHGVRHRLDQLGVQTLVGHPVDQAVSVFDSDHVSVQCLIMMIFILWNYKHLIVQPASLVIALIGLFWTIQRAL